MKAIQIEKPGVLKFIEMEKPQINKNDNVLIRLRAVGICGSDVGIYHGTNAAATYPRVIGHEMVGEVVETGDSVVNLRVGDRVIIDQVVNCGECYPCKNGRGNVCDNLKVRGVHIDGGYREYMAVTEKDCHLIPDDLEYKDAIMIEPTTIAIQGCSRANISPDDTVLILGYGALGSSILRIAVLSGAKIIVADVVSEKLDEALKNGANFTINLKSDNWREELLRYTKGRGTTVTIDAACTKDSLMNALKVTGNAGRVITMGFDIADININQFLITSKELDVRGSRLQNKKFAEAIELINEKKLSLKGSVSHTFPFEKAQEAFDFIDSKDPSIRKIALILGE